MGKDSSGGLILLQESFLKVKLLFGVSGGLLVISFITAYVFTSSGFGCNFYTAKSQIDSAILPDEELQQPSNQTQTANTQFNKVDQNTTHAWLDNSKLTTTTSQNNYLLTNESTANLTSSQNSTDITTQSTNSSSGQMDENSQQNVIVNIDALPNVQAFTSPTFPTQPTFLIKPGGIGFQVMNTSSGRIFFQATEANSVFAETASYPYISVLVAPGNYSLNSTINLRSNQYWQGYGATLNIINATTRYGDGAAVFCASQTTYNTTIEGFAIKLNNNDYFTQGIYLNNPYDCVVKNNKIYQAYNRGINLDAYYYTNWGANNQVIGNYVEKTYADFLGETIVLGNQNNSLVFNNTVVASEQGGITLSGSYGTLVINNTILNSDGQGVGYGGIDLEGSSYNSIINNQIAGTGNGIRVSRGSFHNNFINNTIKDAIYGILLIDTMGPASYNTFQGNQVNSGNTAILIHTATCSNNIFSQNILRPAKGAIVEDHGKDNSYINNR